MSPGGTIDRREAKRLWNMIAAHFQDGRSFTTADAMEVIRHEINPMKVARVAERLRKVTAARRRRAGIPKSEPHCGTHRGDDVSVGLRWMASNLIQSRIRSGSAERIEPGVYRLTNNQPTNQPTNKQKAAST